MMMNKSSKVLMGLTLVFTGCSVEPEDIEGDELLVEAERDASEEIVENLERAGYPAENIAVREDGTVWVGGDAKVTLGASREMLGLTSRQKWTDEDDFRQYRTNNLVSELIGTICIDGSDLEGYSDLDEGLDAAIVNYNDLDLSFTMQRTQGETAGCDAIITSVAEPGTLGGSAGFPSGGLPYDTINIGTALDGFGVPLSTHVIVHELGHCIGFRHTDYFNRSISCGTGSNEGDYGVGAVHIPNTPVGAVVDGSVMNSCFDWGSTGTWTDDDIVALLELYPDPEPDPNSCEETSSCGGQAPGGCWCDAICTFYGDCCSDGPCVPSGNPMSCIETNSCGWIAPGGCWCDAWCPYFGDCCVDGPC